MTYARLARHPLPYLALLAIAILASLAAGGYVGVAGMTLGLLAATFGMAALWQVIKLMGVAVTRGWTAGAGTVLTVCAFIAKLPLYVVLFGLAKRLGDPAPTCFLAGLALVYLVVVAWALARQ